MDAPDSEAHPHRTTTAFVPPPPPSPQQLLVRDEVAAAGPVRLGDLQLCMSGFDESDGAALTVKSVISW